MHEDDHNAPVPSEGELLRLMVESARDYAILSLDPSGCVTSWNPGAERLLGWCEGEILGRSADVVFTPEDRAAGVPDEERRVAAASGRAADDRWSMRKDGTRFFASGLMMRLDDARVGFVKILRDRTAQHGAETRLRESEERFRLLAASIPQLVFRTRPDGTRTWGSPQWVAFTGLDLGRSVGFGWMDAIHPDDRAVTAAAWAEAPRRGAYYVEHRVRRAADGAWRWHQTRARPVDDLGAGEWVGTTTDIHDLRSLKDRQQVLLAELQHRTRNVLAVVQAIAGHTLRSSASFAEFASEYQHRLRALGRVQSLLARTDHADADLRDLVAAEMAAHGQGVVARAVRIAGPSVALSAASAQTLGLALHELATNAVKHGALAQPGARLEVTWREEAHAGEPCVVIEWAEHGVAMPPPGAPVRKGFGRELIERALPYQLGARTTLAFAADGVRCAIVVPLRGTVGGG